MNRKDIFQFEQSLLKLPLQILQVLSVTLFERTPILPAFDDPHSQEKSALFSNQMNLLQPDASDIVHLAARRLSLLKVRNLIRKKLSSPGSRVRMGRT